MTVYLWIILAVLLVTNAFAFALMGNDKLRAKKGQWRIKEKHLFLATACFGGLGGTLGMLYFRHKTKHWYFVVGFPALLLVQIAVLVWLAVRFL